MSEGSGSFTKTSDDHLPGAQSVPVIIATNFRESGKTGVHTHITQWRAYLERHGTPVDVVTPFTWNRMLTYPVFSPRLLLRYCNKQAGLMWYRHWHEVFLRNGLRRALAATGDCVVYAQGPLEARAALWARQDKRQRVIMAVHFRASQADEHAEPGREIKRDSRAFKAIRNLERDVILQVDGIIYVSEWARQALLKWLPEAAAVRSAVIGNAVEPVVATETDRDPTIDLVTVGRLDTAKNHRFILDVLAAAKTAGRSLTLDIFGAGPLLGDLRRQISERDLTDQVRLLGFRSNVRSALPSYRAYVHASYRETSSLAIIEAMAAGLPIVAADIGPISELCGDGAEARFWPLDDPSHSAAILIELLDSPAALSTAARAARERFRRDFDVNVVGERMKSFLLES